MDKRHGYLSVNLKRGENTLDETVHRFDHQAMHTVFEIFSTHPDSEYAGQAAHEAFRLLDRIESNLSRFISNSDISRINRSPHEKIRVSEDTMACLKIAQRMEQQTGGHFNITIGRTIDLYKQNQGGQTNEAPSALRHLSLDTDRYSALLLHDHALLDLGGIAKGYAIDKIIALLDEWEIRSALVHGGQSTVFAYGSYRHHPGWPVSFSFPDADQVKLYSIEKEAISASGLEKGAHIINPETMRPVKHHTVWSAAPTAAEADALSTAWMSMNPYQIASFCESRKGYGGIKYTEKSKVRTYQFGRLKS